jgi:hypothetical protein
MKFRRLACDCCKSSEFPSLCKSPTYVLSEVVEESNIIFLLTTKRGRTSCSGPLARANDPAEQEREVVACEDDLPEPREIVLTGRTGAEFLDGRSRLTRRIANNNDFEPAESPIRRNERLLEEGSGFWPKRTFDWEGDAAVRERE